MSGGVELVGLVVAGESEEARKESELSEEVDIGFAICDLDFMEENDMRTPLDPPSSYICHW